MKSVLEISNLKLSYGDHLVLDSVSATLQHGTLTALIGRNGAGKSSLLNAIMGQVEVAQGLVTLGGRNMNDLSIREQSEQISIVRTGLPDLGYMTAYDFVALGRYPYSHWSGRLKKTDDQIIQKVLESMKIQPLAARYLFELSDGERQKTIIARSLVQDTPIILMDEPIAFIDPVASLEILALLKNQCRDLGKSILYSTHDLGSAYAFADHFWLIDGQGCLESGDPKSMVGEGLVEKAFGKEGYTLSESMLGFKPK